MYSLWAFVKINIKQCDKQKMFHKFQNNYCKETECDRYQKERQNLLQRVTGITKCDTKLLQIVTVIAKCDSCYKVRRNKF